MGTAVVASASCGLGMAAEHNLKIKALTTATAGPPPKILDRKDPCHYAMAAFGNFCPKNSKSSKNYDKIKAPMICQS